MTGGAVLDTVIGLAFVFFLVALFCSAVVESIANLFKKRAKYLLRGLRDLLDTPDPEPPKGVGLARLNPRGITSRTFEKDLYDAALAARPTDPRLPTDPAKPTEAQLPGWTIQLLGHQLVRPFKQSRSSGGQTRNPAYLPSKTFAAALVDLIVPDSTGVTTINTIRNAVTSLDKDVPFRQALLSLITAAGNDIDTFMTSVEGWYDGQMDRISGAYKRWAKRWLIVFALAVSVFLHVDAIGVGRSLYIDGPLRDGVVAAATNKTLCEQGKPFAETKTCVTGELSVLAKDGLPIGWPYHPDGAAGWFYLVLGTLLTAGAASFGAPFWFDVLNRLGSVRNSGDKPKASS